MDGYGWFKVGVFCVGLLIIVGLFVRHEREEKRSRERLKKIEAEKEELSLRNASRNDPFAERRNPAEGKTRGMKSGYVNSLAVKMGRDVPPPAPSPVRQPLTSNFRTQQRGGNVPSSSSVRDTHYQEPDNTIPYLVAAAVLLSDSGDNNSYRESCPAPVETSRDCYTPSSSSDSDSSSSSGGGDD